MTKKYEKVQMVQSVIGAIVSGVSSSLYLNSNEIGVGKIVVFTILAAVVGAAVVFGAMDSVRNTDEAIAVGILLDLVMPIISIVATYCFMFVYAIGAFVIKVFSIFGWSTFGIVAAILIGLFFYVLHELIG